MVKLIISSFPQYNLGLLIPVKITNVRTAIVGASFAGVQGERWMWTFVRVDTDTGISGFGEGALNPRIKNLVVGKDPLDIDDVLRNVGTSRVGRSGLEMALLDIKGKHYGLPAYRFLGGKNRDRVRMYAECGVHGEDPQDWATRAKTAKDMGYRAICFRIDRPEYSMLNKSLDTCEIQLMRKEVEAAREALGDDLDLMIDCHRSYTVESAIRLANAIEEFNIRWFEDPVHPGNIDLMAKISSKTRIPLCASRELTLKSDYKGLIEQQIVGIVKPQIVSGTGLFEFKKIAEMAETYYIPVGAQMGCSPLGTIATCHVAASTPNFLVMESNLFQDHPKAPSWEDFVKGQKPIIRDGCIVVPESPGLGVELDEEVFRGNLEEGSNFFE